MEAPRLSTVLAFVVGVVHCTPDVDYPYMGCYDPGYSLRNNYHHHIIGVTLESCIAYCANRHLRYAGLEKSDNFCYCGNDIATESVKRDDSLCNVPCPGLADKTCGGDWLISVYDLNPAGTQEDSDHVRFLLGISVGVRLYNSSNIESYDTVMTTTDWAYSVDYHYQKGQVFVFTKKKLFTTSLQPKMTESAAVPKLIRAVSICDGFAVDWVKDRIFWTECGQNTTIMTMDLEGNNVSPVMKRPVNGVSIKRMEIDPYKEVLFWIADGTIEYCQLTGADYQTNVSAPGVGVRALTLDTKNRRVYYVGTINQTTSLFSMDYDGGSHQEHFSLPQMKSVYGLGLLHGNLYWVNYANVKDVIYKAPLELTSISDVTMLKVIDRAVWHMKVVHPDLQKPPRRDPCEDKGCSHQCVKESPTSAHCSCPEDQDLDEDGVTCTHVLSLSQNSVRALSVGAVLVALLLVLVVILLSGASVYLADKHWSSLQDKFFSIPYSRTKDTEQDPTGSSSYDASQDNVVLI